jgi:hypothetical protein
LLEIGDKLNIKLTSKLLQKLINTVRQAIVYFVTTSLTAKNIAKPSPD